MYDHPPYYLSAYGLAVKHGFVGTEEEWLESLGAIPGKSAYQQAVEGGYPGTEDQFNAELSNFKSYATEASTASTTAQMNATEAADSASTAVTSAAAAQTNATAAADSANAAAISAAAAQTNATVAADSASAAATSADAANTARQAAETAAERDVPAAVTSWLDTHVNPSTGYVIDNTLTLSGAAADAAATGAAVGELKSTTNELYTLSELDNLYDEYSLPSVMYRRGSATGGQPVYNITNRIVTPDIIKLNKPFYIGCVGSRFRVTVLKYNDDDSYASAVILTDAQTYYAPANKGFRIAVSRIAEDEDASEIANVIEFASKVRMYKQLLMTDDSLTIHGAAADAKVTGDAVNYLNDALTTSVGNNNALFGATWTSGYTFLDDGTEATNNLYRYCDYIPVVDGDYYIVTKNSAESPRILRLFGYDTNKENPTLLIKQTYSQNSDYTSYIFHIDGLKYIRLSYVIKDNIYLYNSAPNIASIINGIESTELGFNKLLYNSGYINCLNDPVNITTPTSTSNYEYVVSECSYGDIFVIKGIGSSTAKLWCFLDANKHVILSTDATADGNNTNDKNIYIEAPLNAAYLVHNIKLETNPAHYCVKITDSVLSHLVNILPYNGKKIAFYGDSRTWYDGHPYNDNTKPEWKGKTCIGYQYYVRKITNAICDNYGVSGESVPEICARIMAKDFTGYDGVFLAGGINDFFRAVTLGTIQPIGSEFDTNTTCGAWQAAIEYLQTNFPNIRIFIDVTPIAWKGTDVYPYNQAKIKAEIAELYNLPCIDLYKGAGITSINRDHFFVDAVSNNRWVHFNDYGNAVLGKMIGAFINSNFILAP